MLTSGNDSLISPPDTELDMDYAKANKKRHRHK